MFHFAVLTNLTNNRLTKQRSISRIWAICFCEFL